MELKDLLTFILVLILSVSGSEMEGNSMKTKKPPTTTTAPTTTAPTTTTPATTTTAPIPTNPATPDSECAAGANPPLDAGDPVADPDNCSNFYVCNGTDGGYSGPFPCPNGECFDPITRMCTIIQTACTGCKPFTPVSKCKSTCEAQYDQVADPNDCGEHYICLQGEGTEWIMYPQHCSSERPFFDGYECVTEETQCCKCQPPTCYTGDGGKSLTDPQDCKSYYLCVDFGQPTSQTTFAYHITCPDNGSFNNHTLKCDSDTKECHNDCDSGVDVGKTTPISSSSKATTTSSSSSSTETATPSSGTSTAKTTTTTPGCTDLSDFTCPPGNGGYYARCSFCHSSYFDCTGPDAPTQKSCSMDLVFNTNPKYPKCILPEKCPFNP